MIIWSFWFLFVPNYIKIKRITRIEIDLNGWFIMIFAIFIVTFSFVFIISKKNFKVYLLFNFIQMLITYIWDLNKRSISTLFNNTLLYNMFFFTSYHPLLFLYIDFHSVIYIIILYFTGLFSNSDFAVSRRNICH